MSAEQNVAEAAMAVVSPHSDPQIRASASQFLEEWTKTDGAWEIYAVWLQHQLDGMSSADDIQLGMQLLSMQLLQSKIRREIPRGTTPNGVLERIHHCLARILTSAANFNPKHVVLQPASICYAALSVRCGGLNHVISQATVDPSGPVAPETMPPSAALRILSNVPLEVEACSDLTTSRVTEELWPFLEPVLESCCRYMVQPSAESAALATEAIERWTQCCHVSLSQLNTPIGEQKTVVLPVLVHLLSQSQYSDEQLPVKASKSLVEAILVPTDACSDSRRVACEALLSAISSGGFITAPLQFATTQGWEDACHALANVVCTLVTEEVDYCVTQPLEPLLSLLLQIQSHPQMKVGCLVLECWLTVQEVPTGQRHENWKIPLFTKVVEVLVNRMAFPVQFVNWEEELHVDESEFQEFRRMVKDVLISAYFLLRGNFVRSMAQAITQPQQHPVPWNVQEAALFALTVSAREVCTRIKARGGGTSVGRDREETTQMILALAQSLCGTDQALAVQELGTRHWLVLVGACDWLSAYAATWGAKCSAESDFQILKFLCIALNLDPPITNPASRALKSVMVGCAPKLSEASVLQDSLSCIKESMDTVLTKQDEAAMTSVAEGCTRLSVQLSDESAIQAAISALIGPLIHRCGVAMKILPESASEGLSEQSSDALDALDKYLATLQVIIRFCERREGQSAAELMNLIWPFLETASQVLVPYEDARKKVLLIHEQLLKNMPALAATRFEVTIKYMVRIFETSKDPNVLGYIESAVEVFGPGGQFDFEQLLCHVFAVLSPTLQAKPLSESNDLVAALYHLCGRYLIYTPATLAQSNVLADVVALAVVCIKECKGQREVTIESLNFLSRLYNWRGLPLSDEAKLVLQHSSQRLDEILARNGKLLVESCIEVLVGGSQILWPASSDCLFSVVLWSLGAQVPSSVLQWLETVKTPDQAVYRQVVQLLVNLAKNGTKSKAKAKLLLSDFSNICKGEASPDILLSYAL